MREWDKELERLKATHRLRALQPASGIDFSSNDYLGFARHPALKAALVSALEGDAPLGAAGARLLRGNHPAHESLEAKAAEFFGAERALYFGNGFMANFAIFTTLATRHDVIIYDEHVHASMHEGIHAAQAQRFKVRHNDTASFRDALTRAKESGAQQIFMAAESVYSMDGDIAPLPELATLAREFDAILIVDEAHATGIFGDGGRGFCAALSHENLLVLHTCGKALGVSGALLGGPASLIAYMVNRARPFIYSTAPPPALAAAVERALALLGEEPQIRETLLSNMTFAALCLGDAAGDAVRFSGTPIIPVILGDDERALKAAQALQHKGFDVRAIRPPTVPAGTARLRIIISATQSQSDIAAMARALKDAL